MKLTDLDNKNVAKRALRENFSMEFDTSALNRPKTVDMLKKVKLLMKESRNSHEFHKTQTSPNYMKLVFMEQALTTHLKSLPPAKIIVENNEVDKSQVILAAQDMVDTIQKTWEDVNDMIVKELPALTDSIQSQIGVNESTSFNQAATTTLGNLNTALQQAMTEMKNALGILTGQAGGNAFAAAPGAAPAVGGAEAPLDVPVPGDDASLDADLSLDGGEDDLNLDLDLGDDDAVGVVGRAKR